MYLQPVPGQSGPVCMPIDLLVKTEVHCTTYLEKRLYFNQEILRESGWQLVWVENTLIRIAASPLLYVMMFV